MRRIILVASLVLFAYAAPAQRRGGSVPAVHSIGAGAAVARGGLAIHNARPLYSPRFRSAYLPYGYGDAGLYPIEPDYGAPYLAAPLIAPALQPDPEPPSREAHSVVIDYKPAALESTAPATEPQNFAIVLRNGSTLSATTMVTINGMLHYVDPDERHMQIALTDVDRDATLRLNRERRLTVHLP